MPDDRGLVLVTGSTGDLRRAGARSSRATSCGRRRSPRPGGFGIAAREAGVGRIVYLGGLGDPASDLSRHLRSRQQTGEAIRAAGVPVTEFRAGVIVGSGSLSFEMIRYLDERVPVMICPRWVRTRIPPIAVRNVLDCLTAVLERPAARGRMIETGGADVVTCGEMPTVWAREPFPEIRPVDYAEAAPRRSARTEADALAAPLAAVERRREVASRLGLGDPGERGAVAVGPAAPAPDADGPALEVGRQPALERARSADRARQGTTSTGTGALRMTPDETLPIARS